MKHLSVPNSTYDRLLFSRREVDARSDFMKPFASKIWQRRPTSRLKIKNSLSGRLRQLDASISDFERNYLDPHKIRRTHRINLRTHIESTFLQKSIEKNYTIKDSASFEQSVPKNSNR